MRYPSTYNIAPTTTEPLDIEITNVQLTSISLGKKGTMLLSVPTTHLFNRLVLVGNLSNITLHIITTTFGGKLVFHINHMSSDCSLPLPTCKDLYVDFVEYIHFASIGHSHLFCWSLCIDIKFKSSYNCSREGFSQSKQSLYHSHI